MRQFLILGLLCSLFSAGAYAEDPDFFGGFRYRFEKINQEGGIATRERHRMKATLGVKAQLSDELSYIFALISGSDDPTSGNQTFDNAASSKSVNIDQAEFTYQSPWHISIGGGKMKGVFFQPGKTELIWDGDLRPEGLRVVHGMSWDNFKYNLTLAHFQLEERNGATLTESVDSTMNGAQLKTVTKAGPIDITLGASIFDYEYIKGQAPLYDNSNSFSNTLAGGNYATAFSIQEIFLVFDFEVGNLPISVFGDMATNIEADEDDSAYLYGLSLGQAKKANSWQLIYSYREVEADAVLGIFTDSDFKGGGTDGKGHEIAVKYAMTDSTSLAVTQFLSETSLTEANAKDYDRTQVDFSLKF